MEDSKWKREERAKGEHLDLFDVVVDREQPRRVCLHVGGLCGLPRSDLIIEDHLPATAGLLFEAL